MPKKKAETKKNIDEEKVKEAIVKVKANLISIRKAAKEIGIHEWTLRDRIKHSRRKVGGLTSLPESSERKLALALSLKSKWGFASTRDEVRNIVKEYVDDNKGQENELGEYLKTNCRFKDNKPGEDWLKAFMNRWNLSVKLPSTLEKSRKLAVSDPNIIYGFFDLLEGQLDKLGIRHRSECIWNVDETNLYIDPQRTKVVAPRGEKASRTTSTSGSRGEVLKF